MQKKGRVVGYSPDTGYGVVVEEDDQGNQVDRFRVSFEAFPEWLSTLEPGEEVTFEVDDDRRIAMIEPITPRAAS